MSGDWAPLLRCVAIACVVLLCAGLWVLLVQAGFALWRAFA